MQDSPDAKKPCKGILKTSSSFDRPSASYRKSAKFDELNVLQTYHPQDKDYGHMKIDEPKTPYNYAEADPEQPEQLDADLLAEKLRIAANTQTPSFGADEDDDVSEDEDFPETEEEKVRRVEFERRRKAHYNEFEAVRLARKLIEEELDDDDDDEDDGEAAEGESTIKTNTESDRVNSAGSRSKRNAGEDVETTSGVESTGATLKAGATTNSSRPMDVDRQ